MAPVFSFASLILCTKSSFAFQIKIVLPSESFSKLILPCEVTSIPASFSSSAVSASPVCVEVSAVVPASEVLVSPVCVDASAVVVFLRNVIVVSSGVSLSTFTVVFGAVFVDFSSVCVEASVVAERRLFLQYSSCFCY